MISFNWDALVERLARRMGLKLAQVTPGAGFSLDCVNFAKPHGSLSWVLDHGSHLLTHQQCGLPLFESKDPMAVSGACPPFVLGAVPIKAELLQEVQEYWQFRDVYPIVMSQWKAVAEAVANADKLTVAGYSFPPEDGYGRFFFQEGIRRRVREHKSPLHVEFYQLPEHQAETAKSICETLKHPGLRIEWCGPVEPPSSWGPY